MLAREISGTSRKELPIAFMKRIEQLHAACGACAGRGGESSADSRFVRATRRRAQASGRRPAVDRRVSSAGREIGVAVWTAHLRRCAARRRRPRGPRHQQTPHGWLLHGTLPCGIARCCRIVPHSPVSQRVKWPKRLCQPPACSSSVSNPSTDSSRRAGCRVWRHDAQPPLAPGPCPPPLHQYAARRCLPFSTGLRPTRGTRGVAADCKGATERKDP
jgi:hypothetical protein